jgi:hypothetical protein
MAAGPLGAAAQEALTGDLGVLLHTHRLLQAGYDGQGVRVGVISDGASNYATLVAPDVLPSEVAAFPGEESNQGDEGDWMLQVVHQLAPQARLAFCAGGSAQDTDDCARELVTHFHADVVVDDTNPQPVFDFPSPKAIGFAEIAGTHPDVLFFTPAALLTAVPKAFYKARDLARAHTRLFDGMSVRQMPTLHEIRALSSHLYATAGYEVAAVQELMAHTDPDMTRSYQRGHARKVLRVEMMLPYRVQQPDNAVREARAVYRAGASPQGQKIFPGNSLSESWFAA